MITNEIVTSNNSKNLTQIDTLYTLTRCLLTDERVCSDF